ncbi:hypothetical protein [Rhizobium laguerreae]|uniref:hypothetical protein n=1 Tax=Rhizobium laguerreae TaxID=1076926 RepID=UPI001C8FC22E|nr:hypothetical protein [Rhizobium laguerreae]MBY3134810.1 hypothetical protein [Rhizobium laguerreae]
MGYIFLGNAVDRVGRFLFPDSWDGTENVTPELFALATTINGVDYPLSSLDAKPRERRIIHELVALRRPEFRREYTIRYGPAGEVIPKLSSQEWAAGLQEAGKIDAERRPKLQRREACRRFIKKAILDGRLTFVLRPKRGGAFSRPQDRKWWNVEDHDRIFYWCQMDPQNATGNAVGGDRFQYVFVDETELNAIAPSPEQLNASDGEDGLSGSLQRAPSLDTSAVADQVSLKATENTSATPEGASVIISQDGGFEFTATERDIHAAIQLIWQGGPTPSAKGQLQAAVDKYLKSTLQYTKTPDPRTYQRYFKKIGATFLDK